MGKRRQPPQVHLQRRRLLLLVLVHSKPRRRRQNSVPMEHNLRHFADIMICMVAHTFAPIRDWVCWSWNYVMLETELMYDMTCSVCWLSYQFGWNESCAFANLHIFINMMSCLFILFAKPWHNMWKWGVYFTLPKFSSYDIVSYG